MSSGIHLHILHISGTNMQIFPNSKQRFFVFPEILYDKPKNSRDKNLTIVAL